MPVMVVSIQPHGAVKSCPNPAHISDKHRQADAVIALPSRCRRGSSAVSVRAVASPTPGTPFRLRYTKEVAAHSCRNHNGGTRCLASQFSNREPSSRRHLRRGNAHTCRANGGVE